MSESDGKEKELELDDLTMPGDDFEQMPVDELEQMPVDGMADPTAQPLAAVEETPAKKKKKEKKPKKEKVKKEKPVKEKKPRDPNAPSIFSQAMLLSPYTVMLAVSALAIGVGLLCLILEWNSYGFNRKPPKTLSLNGNAAVHSTLAGHSGQQLTA